MTLIFCHVLGFNNSWCYFHMCSADVNTCEREDVPPHITVAAVITLKNTYRLLFLYLCTAVWCCCLLLSRPTFIYNPEVWVNLDPQGQAKGYREKSHHLNWPETRFSWVSDVLKRKINLILISKALPVCWVWLSWCRLSETLTVNICCWC